MEFHGVLPLQAANKADADDADSALISPESTILAIKVKSLSPACCYSQVLYLLYHSHGILFPMHLEFSSEHASLLEM